MCERNLPASSFLRNHFESHSLNCNIFSLKKLIKIGMIFELGNFLIHNFTFFFSTKTISNLFLQTKSIVAIAKSIATEIVFATVSKVYLKLLNQCTEENYNFIFIFK